ncbi:MAG: TonB-dependent receptor, partial [Porticoccaceae bacterium]
MTRSPLLFPPGRSLFLGCCLVAAIPVFAAPLDEVIVTSSRVAEQTANLVGNSAVVDQAALKMIAHVHIQETLAQLPGVDMHRNNGQEYLPAIRSPVLSGAGACGSFLIAEDGIPLRPAGFCNVNELFEAH